MLVAVPERANAKMDVKIKGGKLLVEIDLEEPRPSSTGKTRIIATTYGTKLTTATFRGKPVSVVLHAFIPPKPGQVVSKYDWPGWGKLITLEDLRGNNSSKKSTRKKK